MYEPLREKVCERTEKFTESCHPNFITCVNFRLPFLKSYPKTSKVIQS